MNRPASAPPAPTASPRKRTNRVATTAALLLALFMAAMEMTVVSTAMPTVISELGGALHYAWVFAAYMLASTVLMPIHGKLADLYGRKPVMLAAMAIFLFGSMASGQAHSMTALIVFRAVQGIGAGGLQPLAFTIVRDIFDFQQNARMQGVMGAVWGIAGLAGPLLGGIIVSTLSWRWVFYVNVPFGLLSMVLLSTSFIEVVDKKERTLDVAGAALLSLFVMTLLLGVEGALPWVLLPASVVLGIAFVFVELRATEPMLPPRLFATPVLGTSSVSFALMGVVLIGAVTFLPLYAQGVLGASPTEAGAAIAPVAVGWPIAATIAGRIIPIVGFRPLVRTGVLVIALAMTVLALIVQSGGSTTHLRLGTAVLGVGMGTANTALLVAVQSSVDHAERGVATASTVFFRSIGGTIGVGVLGVVVAHALQANPLVHEGGGADLVARILGPERATMRTSLLDAVATDLKHGIGRVVWVCAALGGLAVLVGWLFPNVPAGEESPQLRQS